MIEGVEEAADIKIENPVELPTTLSRFSYGIDRRPLGPVPIRVGVELRFHHRLQVQLDDRLGNSIGNRRNDQISRATVMLWNCHPEYGRREVRS